MFTSCTARCLKINCSRASVRRMRGVARITDSVRNKHCKASDFLLNLNVSANGDPGDSKGSRIVAPQDHE